MAESTEISWCDSSFSAWIGCTKVSPACNSCYAESLNKRFSGGKNWGPGAPRRRTSDANWKFPISWQRNHAKFFAQHGRRRRVFLNNQADIFDNEVDQSWREEVWGLIDATPDIDWLLLSKRIGNAKNMLPGRWADRLPENIWLGITVIDQEEADRDIPKLLATPARLRFLSIEPMLGPIDLTRVYGRPHNAPFSVLNARPYGYVRCVDHAPGYCLGDCEGRLPAVDWVIAGAESGRGARALHLNWVRSIVQQCHAAGVAVHVKQLGHDVYDTGMSSPGQHWPWGTVKNPIARISEEDPPFVVRLKHAKGGDLAEWPEDLRTQEFPSA